MNSDLYGTCRHCLYGTLSRKRGRNCNPFIYGTNFASRQTSFIVSVISFIVVCMQRLVMIRNKLSQKFSFGHPQSESSGFFPTNIFFFNFPPNFFFNIFFSKNFFRNNNSSFPRKFVFEDYFFQRKSGTKCFRT